VHSKGGKRRKIGYFATPLLCIKGRDCFVGGIPRTQSLQQIVHTGAWGKADVLTSRQGYRWGGQAAYSSPLSAYDWMMQRKAAKASLAPRAPLLLVWLLRQPQCLRCLNSSDKIFSRNSSPDHRRHHPIPALFAFPHCP
jgi:hypothetical protein